MKASDIRKKEAEDLREEIDELRKQQFKLRMQGRTGQSFKHDRIKKNRRDIARIYTVLNEMKTADAGDTGS